MHHNNSRPYIEPGNIFLDINIINNTQPTIIAQYNALLGQDLIDSANRYDVSVFRFKYPNGLIPLSERFVDGQYNITLSFDEPTGNGFSTTQDLLNADMINGTPFIISYNDWVSAMNAALGRGWDLMKLNAATNVPSIGGYPAFDTLSPPSISYDAVTQLFSLYYDSRAIAFSDPAKWNTLLWFNLPVNLNFAFPTIKINRNVVHYDTTTFGPYNDYLFNFFNNQFSSSPDPTNFVIEFSQNYKSIGNFSGLESVIVKTGLPVVNEVSVVNLNNVSSAGSGGAYNFSSILTDFEVGFGQEGRDLSGYDFYAAGGSPRRYGMSGHAPIRDINIQIFWKSTLGNYYPLLIGLGQNVNIKLEFRRISRGEYITNN